LKEKITPLLLGQKGFQERITLLTAAQNEAIAISFWESEEDADAYNHVVYLDVLRTLSKIVEWMPTVENFEILDATPGQFLGAISSQLAGGIAIAQSLIVLDIGIRS
jgi:hypothetical protein